MLYKWNPKGGSLGIINLRFIYDVCISSLFSLILSSVTWRASLVAQLVKNPPAMRNTLVRFLGQEVPLEKDRLPTPVFLGFPGGSDGKESACGVGGLGSIPGLGRCPGGKHGNPFQYSCLVNPHGQRSLVGYSLRGHAWVNKQSTTQHSIT